MARVVSSSMLWMVICVQLAFFIVLSGLYVWRDRKLSPKMHYRHCLTSCQDIHKSHPGHEGFSGDHHHRLRTIQRKRPHRVPGVQLHTKDYQYSLNPAARVCSEPGFLLVLVESTTYNAMERAFFRARWKVHEYHGKRIVTVFVTARPGIESAQELLRHEYRSHGDILHIDFVDSYRNLTLKTMLGLRWAVDECQPFKYIMKTDDDMIVNFDVLIRQLESMPSHLIENLYTGVMMSHKKPIRDESDKWHVTIEEYPHDKYPDYMGGPGYVMSYQAVNKIIAASYKVPFMPMEDVFVGICAKEAGINGYSNLRFSNWEIWDYYQYCWAREMTILHNADFAVRELYYHDKFINSHSFNFNSWQRTDITKSVIFSQKKVNKYNEVTEFIGYPMVYKCSPRTWQIEKAKCMRKHLYSWRIPKHKIIDF